MSPSVLGVIDCSIFNRIDVISLSININVGSLTPTRIIASALAIKGETLCNKHFVTWTDTQRHHCNLRPMHSPQHPSHRDSPGDVTLEFPDLLPKDQLSQVDHISNRCINLRFDLLVLTLNIHHMEVHFNPQTYQRCTDDLSDSSTWDARALSVLAPTTCDRRC